MINSAAKVFLSFFLTFSVGILMAPFLTNYLYKNKMWKKKARNEALGGGETPIFNQLHKEKETGTPRMGGIIIWVSTLITIFILSVLSDFFPGVATQKLNFLSQNQTWLPLFALVSASFIGLVDDILQVRGGGGYVAGGLALSKRVLFVLTIGFVGAYWFYFKLGMTAIAVPFAGPIELGTLFIPFFILVMLAIFSGGVIDGIDGLAGGIMAVIFSAYGVIAFFQNQIDLATFCAAIVGGILAFLWFNVPPARFYMSETGMLGLTVTLSIIAFLTDSVIVLPIIAFPLIATSASVIIQYLSKRYRGKKVFLVAPLHHHFEAMGWSAAKVTMRYWILSIIFAVVGMIISILGITLAV
jgi:phospho-N-acetylmuramoyl-pentapeptide-transferase